MLYSLIALAFGNPQQASIALKQSNCAKAIAAYPAPVESHYKLAIGQCHLSMGNFDEATKLLQEVDGDFQHLAAELLAQTALLHLQPNQALLFAQNLQSPKAQLIKAQAYLHLEEYYQTRDLLRPLLTNQNNGDGYIPQPNEIDPAQVRWLLAESARLRGATTSAIPVYWRIWMSNPTSKYSELSAERLIALGERIPDSTTEIGRERIARRARTLRKLQLHQAALQLLDILPQPETQEDLRKYAYYVFSAKEYKRALMMFQSLENLDDEDYYHMAVSAVRSGDYDASSLYYHSLIAQFPRSKWADYASFKIAYLEYDRGDLEKAIILFEEHLQRFPTSKHADEARYFSAWSFTKLQRYEEAKNMYAIVQRQHFSSSLAPGAAFWHAWILQQEGQQEAAIEGFEYLLSTWPNSGYSWQATHYLQRRFPQKEIAVVPPPPALLDVPAFHLGQDLAEIGFEQEAQNQLLPLISVVSGHKEASLVLAHALIDAGAYRDAQKIAGPYCTQPWKGGDPLAMQACYPRPQYEIVQSTLHGHDLPAHLPYAIMTAESGLNPTVSSPAGARGMMQLMPYVAESLHQQTYPTQIFDPDQLFLSGYNITLGTQELMRLYTSLQDTALSDPLPATIAGYNAGEEAVRRWLSLYEETPSVAEFSDDIGYSETRKYNRRVLGYLMNYLYIYGEPSKDLPKEP